MAIRGNSITVTYVAWDTVNNVGKTGDVANHTIKVVKDGTEATAANSPAEVDATNAKGVYKLVLSSTEMTCDCITVCGVSSTAGIVIIPLTITTEHGVLPNIQQGNAGAVLTSGTGTAQIETDGAGNAYVNVMEINSVAAAAVYLALMYGSCVAKGTVSATGLVSGGNFQLVSSDISGSNQDFANMILVFTSGANQRIPRAISSYTASGKQVQFTGTGIHTAFPYTPTAGDAWILLAASP